MPARARRSLSSSLFCAHVLLILLLEVGLSQPAILVLEDGSVFRGRSIGFDGQSSGEVVFNTAMTGYQEILTDPSYCQQMVTLTYPHIGNTGTNPEDVESTKVWAPPDHS